MYCLENAYFNDETLKKGEEMIITNIKTVFTSKEEEMCDDVGIH